MAGADFGARQSKVSTSDGVFVRPFADYAVAGKYVRWVLSRSNATVTDYWNQVVQIRAGLPRRKDGGAPGHANVLIRSDSASN
jgi:hypothetical protein